MQRLYILLLLHSTHIRNTIFLHRKSGIVGSPWATKCIKNLKFRKECFKISKNALKIYIFWPTSIVQVSPFSTMSNIQCFPAKLETRLRQTCNTFAYYSALLYSTRILHDNLIQCRSALLYFTGCQYGEEVWGKNE